MCHALTHWLVDEQNQRRINEWIGHRSTMWCTRHVIRLGMCILSSVISLHLFCPGNIAIACVQTDIHGVFINFKHVISGFNCTTVFMSAKSIKLASLVTHKYLLLPFCGHYPLHVLIVQNLSLIDKYNVCFVDWCRSCTFIPLHTEIVQGPLEAVMSTGISKHEGSGRMMQSCRFRLHEKSSGAVGLIWRGIHLNVLIMRFIYI